MRSTTRLLASVQRSSKFLEPYAPTGLTGLLTHPSPRGTLLYLYSSTLEKLKEFPEHSVYRQSAEALTKHRMAILESIKPAGLEEWQKRVQPVVEKHPEAFRKVPVSTNPSEFNIVWKVHHARVQPPNAKEEDPFKTTPPQQEGPRSAAERRFQGHQLAQDDFAKAAALPDVEDEPALTAAQIGEIETKIGAGLIEEIIQVAEGEKVLAEELYKSQVYVDSLREF